MNKLALIIIYNHQYNENIDLLERIYKDRFTNLFHLVPFYDGDKTNVIPVYENSFYFQGYISQGLKIFFNEQFEHYFFVADDLVLNPIINELNYLNILKLTNNSCFLPGFRTLHEFDYWWPRVGEAFHWNMDVAGVEVRNQLPDSTVARDLFNKFGLEIKPLKFDQIYKSKEFPKVVKFWHLFFYLSFHKNRFKNRKKKYDLSYPLVGSYSDIFVINSATIKQFSHYCGIFAATKLFVELAIPTALVLSAQEIITENDLEYKGKELVTKHELKELDKFNYSLDLLLEKFPLNYLYLHPVKLSKWHTLLK